VLFVLLTLACGGGSPKPLSSAPAPGPSSGGAGVAVAPLAAWQKLGATEAPPASVQQVSLAGAQVVNQSGGAVGDADAQAWAQALLRTLSYLRWAVSRGQSTFLLRSGLSSAPVAVFQPNVTDITRAHAAGMSVQYTQETIRRLVVRPVPQSQQATIQGVQEVWKPEAIYLDAVGPVETDWIDAQGNKTVKGGVAAGVPLYELIGGELAHDPVMGDIWVMASDFDCTAASSRQKLAPACNQ
jgi:hypothetical protein